MRSKQQKTIELQKNNSEGKLQMKIETLNDVGGKKTFVGEKLIKVSENVQISKSFLLFSF